MQSIFISYARENCDAALSIFNLLKKQGFSPWIDVKNLLPGQEWELEIDKAIRNSSIFIACLSSNAVSKRGYVQSELKKAIKVLETIPEGKVFLIPVRLDACEVPQKLSHLHWVDYFDKDGPAILVYAITQYLASEKSTSPGSVSDKQQSHTLTKHTNAYQNKAKAYEKILDMLSTRRAFFSGDERVLEDAKSYSKQFEHMWKMLGYLDAGRALVVAYSFAEAAIDTQRALSKLSSLDDGHLKNLISRLIVSCKDYSERYGSRKTEGTLGLPHIGWQYNRYFNQPGNPYGFNSEDSIEIYKTFLEYLSNSCRDLIRVREIARDVVVYIGNDEPLLFSRCQHIKSIVEGGVAQIETAMDILNRTIIIVQEVIAMAPDFQGRLNLLKQRAANEDEKVAYLLWAIAHVRSQH